MGSRHEVEVTLISAKDIKNVNWRYGRTKPYAILWFDPDRKITTRTDEENDTSPQWNQTLKVSLNSSIDKATLTIDIVHYADADEDTKPHIGTAKLDLRDVVEEGGIGTSVTRKLKLKRSSGRPQGKVEVEIVVRDLYQSPNPYPQPHYYGASRSVEYDAPAPAPQYGGYPPYGQPSAYGSGYPAGEYGQPPAGGQPPAYGSGYPAGEYGQPPAGYGGGYDQGHYGQQPVVEEEKKKSSFGGMGTGIAIGAAAGVLGGLALHEGYDRFTDHLAEKAAEKVEEDQDDDDDDDEDDD